MHCFFVQKTVCGLKAGLAPNENGYLLQFKSSNAMGKILLPLHLNESSGLELNSGA